MYAQADAPNRATNKITVAWGLLNIPLSVYTGTESTRVARSEFLDGNTDVPVGRSPIRKDTGEVVESGAVVRMAKATSGAWVSLTDEEVAACTSPKGLAEVVAFVPLKDLNLYVVEKADQVGPRMEKGVPDAAAAQALALLLTAMAERKVAAMIKVAMRGPARYALITPEAGGYEAGTMLYILTADAVRVQRPVDLGCYNFTKAELAMGVALIDAVGVEAPVVTDDTAAAIQAFVDGKAEGVEAPAPVEHTAPTMDIMEQLAASVAAAKAKAA